MPPSAACTGTLTTVRIRRRGNVCWAMTFQTRGTVVAPPRFSGPATSYGTVSIPAPAASLNLALISTTSRPARSSRLAATLALYPVAQ
ncbi:hypothetical protein SAMN04487917_101251 [Arthrobacter sp. yr096]|nr:hypothetical protein SAMN04487917_101251 [Arthrobacter sp. yr096]